MSRPTRMVIQYLCLPPLSLTMLPRPPHSQSTQPIDTALCAYCLIRPGDLSPSLRYPTVCKTIPLALYRYDEECPR